MKLYQIYISEYGINLMNLLGKGSMMKRYIKIEYITTKILSYNIEFKIDFYEEKLSPEQ